MITKKIVPVELEDKMDMLSYAYEGPLKDAIQIARYYGFNLISPPDVKGSYKRNYKDDDFFVPQEEKINILKRFHDGKFANIGTPVLICYTKRNPIKRTTYLRLDVIGSPKSIADALLVATTSAILKQMGTPKLLLDINNIGDKDSYGNYLRDLSAYYKKNLNVLDAKCKQSFKGDVLKILSCPNPKCNSLKDEAPLALSYLSEMTRLHFKEVMEFVENLDLTYRISASAISNTDYANKTVFELKKMETEDDIVNNVDAPSLAKGARYDGLAKKIGLKKNVPAVGVSIKFDNVPQKEAYKRIPTEKRKSKMFLIQFGFSAKLRSLKVMEILRSAKIEVSHNLLKDDLSSQLLAAERSGAPFIGIIGQKEVVEHTLMIRNTNNRSQDSIALSRLADYLKEEIRKLKS
jgi:histidyl-tRNA synthetase